MTAAAFLSGAVALVGLSFGLTRRTSPYSNCGGARYEKRQMWRLLGKVLFLAGMMALGIAVLTEFYAS